MLDHFLNVQIAIARAKLLQRFAGLERATAAAADVIALEERPLRAGIRFQDLFHCAVRADGLFRWAGLTNRLTPHPGPLPVEGRGRSKGSIIAIFRHARHWQRISGCRGELRQTRRFPQSCCKYKSWRERWKERRAS